MGLFGSQDPSRNISLFLAWGIWWTSVVLSWFIVGKLWCGICPFPGIGRLFQSRGISLNLEVPQILKKVFLHLSVVLLGIIIWAESVTNMKDWPAGTSYLLLSILFGASLMGVLFKGQAWCRHVCPLGKITGSAATIAITEFRADHAKCRTCKTFACKKGDNKAPGCPVYLGAYNVRSNFYCLVCGHCVSLCDKNSPAISIRNPFVEITSHACLERKKSAYLTYSYIIPFFMGSQLARFVQHQDWYGGIESFFFGSNLIAFTALLALGFLFFLAVIRLGATFFFPVENDIFGLFSPMVPALIPMAFTGELTYRINYFLSNIGDVLPIFGRQFGINLEHLQFSIPHTVIYWTGLAILISGGLSSSYVLRIFSKHDFECVIKKNFNALYALIILVFSTYAVLYGRIF